MVVSGRFFGTLRAIFGLQCVMLDKLRERHTFSRGATCQLMVLCNRNAVHDLLLQHGFHTTWAGGIRISSVSSGAGATVRVAVVVQTGGGFLSGGCRGASSEDKEDCYGRATVALTRTMTIQLTYILSPVDMAGLPGMAQVLAVYHTGFYTLCHREVREYVHAIVPKDSAAVLEWSLLEPYAPRDHLPLAIPMMISD